MANLVLCTPYGSGWRPAVVFNGKPHVWAGVYDSAEAAISVARQLLNQAEKLGYIA